MKKKFLLAFVLMLASLCLSLNAQAFDYAYAFHDPLLPSSSYRVDQDFAEYNSYYGKYHLGEDRNRGTCDDDYGDNVYSVANGRVMYAQNAGTSWGNVVIIRHILPDITVVNTLYGHLKTINVSVSQDVSLGQKIGELGDAGGYYNCAHLHLELRTDRSLETVPGSGYLSSLSDPLWDDYEDPSDFIANH